MSVTALPRPDLALADPDDVELLRTTGGSRLHIAPCPHLLGTPAWPASDIALGRGGACDRCEE